MSYLKINWKIKRIFLILRQKIHSEGTSFKDVMRWYTNVNAALLEDLTNHIKEADSSTIWR